MGRKIGTLGRVREPLDLEFDYFGSVVRVHPHATDGVEADFLEVGRTVDLSALEDLDLTTVDQLGVDEQRRLAKVIGEVNAAGLRALMDALRALIHPDDFDAYWRVGMANGQQIRDRMADIKAITSAVVEATTDFPTGPRSVSPAGPAATPAGSGGGSPSPGSHPTDLEVALVLERGRPDLQEFYLMEAEFREQEAREQAERDAKDQEKLAAAGYMIG